MVSQGSTKLDSAACGWHVADGGNADLADAMVMASWAAPIDGSWGRLYPKFFTRQLMVNKVGEQTGEQVKK